MPGLDVDGLRFEFPSAMAASKYDEWLHYLKHWNAGGGKKAMDVVATRIQAAPAVVWLIEAKDFRIHTQDPEPSNLYGLAQTVADKARDTLAGLRDAAENASDAEERAQALRACLAKSNRVVLHLEPRTGQHSILFPSNFTASVLQKLRQLVKSIDPNPLVVSIAKPGHVPWKVS